MSILVTGSLAIDRIMVFRSLQGPHDLHMLSVSFHETARVRRLRRHRLRLGADPLIFAAAVRRRPAGHPPRRSASTTHTAQCFITTDLDDNQIVGVPSRRDGARGAAAARGREGGAFSLAIVGPDDNAAMRQHAAALKKRGIRP